MSAESPSKKGQDLEFSTKLNFQEWTKNLTQLI